MYKRINYSKTTSNYFLTHYSSRLTIDVIYPTFEKKEERREKKTFAGCVSYTNTSVISLNETLGIVFQEREKTLVVVFFSSRQAHKDICLVNQQTNLRQQKIKHTDTERNLCSFIDVFW
jgi:hypothetical protein